MKEKVSECGNWTVAESSGPMDVRDLDVYQKLCELHLAIWEATRKWPREERFELTSQILRSSNSAPAQLAEKNCDRHIRNHQWIWHPRPSARLRAHAGQRCIYG